jgi:hypothetical protein
MWADIAIDLIDGLPKVNGRSVILTVVDRFTKSANFLPLGHPYTATTVVRIFFDNVVKLHGILSSIVIDQDSMFTGRFWRELFTLADDNLQFSSAFHPQSDRQSEVMNKTITMYLLCLVGDQPWDWMRWLPWVECCYNTSFQSSIRTSSFRVVYGRNPPTVRSYSLGETQLKAVDAQLVDRDEFLAKVQEQLEQAQQHHKDFYDHKHMPVEFVVREWA